MSLGKTGCGLITLVLLMGQLCPAAGSEGEASLIWRSSELSAGKPVIFGALTRLIATREGLYAFDEQTKKALFIGSGGERSEQLDVQGEAPGHVFMVSDIEVDPSAKYMAIVQGVRAKLAIRSPLRAPFTTTRELTPDSKVPSARAGISARIRWPWLAFQFKEQPFADLKRELGRITLENLETGENSTGFQREKKVAWGPVGPEFWVWDLGPQGVRYISDDNNSPTIQAIAPEGNILWSKELPVKPRRKSEEILRKVRKSYETLEKMAPETPVVIEEYYRRIQNLVCHADKLYVLTSEGIRRGEEKIESVGWLVVSAESGQILDSLILDLPVTLETVIKATFDGHTMYLLGREVESSGENELFSFAVPSSSEH